MYPKIACYCRVSSKEQKNDSQKEAIRRWLLGRNIDPDQVLWFEDVESGATMERKAFKRLQEAVFYGEVETIVVWKLDRLSRDLKDGIDLLCKWCSVGVRLISVTQQIDLDGPTGKLIASVLFGLGDIERNHIRERQAAGIALAKQKGIYKGRKPGTEKVTKEKILEKLGRGLSPVEAAKALGITYQTVWRKTSRKQDHGKTTP